MLRENVEESTALVNALLKSLHIAQSKLAEDQARLAEVASTGRKGEAYQDWEHIGIKVERANVCKVCKGVGTGSYSQVFGSPHAPGVSAGRPSTPE